MSPGPSRNRLRAQRISMMRSGRLGLSCASGWLPMRQRRWLATLDREDVVGVEMPDPHRHRRWRRETIRSSSRASGTKRKASSISRAAGTCWIEALHQQGPARFAAGRQPGDGMWRRRQRPSKARDQAGFHVPLAARRAMSCGVTGETGGHGTAYQQRLFVPMPAHESSRAEASQQRRWNVDVDHAGHCAEPMILPMQVSCPVLSPCAGDSKTLRSVDRRTDRAGGIPARRG